MSPIASSLTNLPICRNPDRCAHASHDAMTPACSP